MELTKAEEQILHYLWKLGEATVQDILSCMEETGRPSVPRYLQSFVFLRIKESWGISRVRDAATYIIRSSRKKNIRASNYSDLSVVTLIILLHR